MAYIAETFDKNYNPDFEVGVIESMQDDYELIIGVN